MLLLAAVLSSVSSYKLILPHDRIFNAAVTPLRLLKLNAVFSVITSRILSMSTTLPFPCHNY